MPIDIPHEFLDPFAGRTLGVTEVVSHPRLQALAQDFHRPVNVIMHFRAHSQHEIVGVLE